MGDVIELDDQRPHYVITVADDDVRVIPAALVDNWINGTVALEDPTQKPLVLAILMDWQARMLDELGDG